MDSLPGKFILSVFVWIHLPAGAGGGTLSHRKTMAKARHPPEHLPCDTAMVLRRGAVKGSGLVAPVLAGIAFG